MCSRNDSEEVAEIAGAHQSYRFELEEGTSSADHSKSSNEEIEIQEDRLIDNPLGNCIV